MVTARCGVEGALARMGVVADMEDVPGLGLGPWVCNPHAGWQGSIDIAEKSG